MKNQKYRLENDSVYEYTDDSVYEFAGKLNGRTKKQFIVDYEEMKQDEEERISGINH